MKIRVRKGEVKDIDVVYALMKSFALFQQTPEKLLTTPAQMIAEAALFRMIVAETAGGTIIGFASFFMAYYSWSGKAMYLDDLYVLEEYRGSGIGKQLLEAVIAAAKKEACKRVRWQVSNWNEKAIHFYKKMGAVIDEAEINCDLTLT